MQKRKSLELDYDHNRTDSIEWARNRCEDDSEIRTFIFGLRRQFRERIAKDFPREFPCIEVLGDDEDPNHFFVFVGKFADMNHDPALKEMAHFFCEQLKLELNLDLHPSVFTLERSYNPRPPKRTTGIS